MPILPLPQFEADLKLQEQDRKAYDALKAPRTLVVRYGMMKLVGEFPYDGSAKPGCGSKIVVRTPRGTELGEMLTSTCPNSGCSKSVSRKQMLDYIENSGGRDYPFFSEGRVLRIATVQDLETQTKVEQSAHEVKMIARRHAEALNLPVKIVDAEPLLGNERVFIYYQSEQRPEFRELGRLISQDVRSRVDFRQVGARDEARLVADYEKCGQHCCCKNFLKVLKPISMKSAKVQKATLDPLKISGRCGRLMCCLRYEDETYETLRKKLPKKKTRVGTPEGDGTVIDGQILTQLVLVRLDNPDKDGKFVDAAVPVESLTRPNSATPPPPPTFPGPEAQRSDARRRDSRGPSGGGTGSGSAAGAGSGPRREDRRDPAPRQGSGGTPPPRGPDRPRPQPGSRPGPQAGPNPSPHSGPSAGRSDRELDGFDLNDIPGDQLPERQGTTQDGPPRPDGPRRGRRRRRRGGGGAGNGGAPSSDHGPEVGPGPQTPPA